MALINNLAVTNTMSDDALQTCTVDLSGGVRIFSYKCCEGENSPVGIGDDYAFTFTYGNMGNCEGTTRVTDSLSVTDTGGVRLKIMDICEPCYGHDIYVSGCVYVPIFGYFCLPFIFPLRLLQLFNVDLVVCPGIDLNFYLVEGFRFDITMPPNSISSAAVLFQVEDIFCDDCPCPACGTNLADINIDEMRMGTEEDLKELLNGYKDELDNVNVPESKPCSKKRR